MTRIDRLFVLWAPKRRRHVIGTLSREGDEFTFRYADDLEEPRRENFEGLIGFPLEKREFRSRHLFAAFSHRIPSPARPDFKMLLDDWGVENPDDALEILARSGGLQVMDRIELAEYRPPDDRLETPLSFRVAGQAYGADPKAIAIANGDPLELVHEPDNPFDASAVAVRARDHTMLGYVPRQYSHMLSSLMSTGLPISVAATRRILVPGDGYRWVVRAQRQS
ncbi:MAG: HIRAN domain-containing protein [Deltaproteobacteria bacterium]|nr:HIRAN domain-containing protein [Deltaproteobacteria bacterium]